jgi:hypothetical protein
MARGAPDGYSWGAPQSLRGIGGSNHYVVDLELPANTPSASPVDLDVILVDGWVAQIALLFPPGPATLAYVTVRVSGSQLYPTGAGQSFHPDNQLIVIPCDFDVPLVGSDYKITLRGWSLDDTWPHTVQAHVWVIPY